MAYSYSRSQPSHVGWWCSLTLPVLSSIGSGVNCCCDPVDGQQARRLILPLSSCSPSTGSGVNCYCDAQLRDEAQYVVDTEKKDCSWWNVFCCECCCCCCCWLLLPVCSAEERLGRPRRSGGCYFEPAVDCS